MEYNPAFIYPANLEDCKKHRMATRIFKGSSQENYDFEKCKCCGRSMGEQSPYVPCCYNPSKELIFLGPGVPLLFVFTRLSILLLVGLLLVFSIYALASNLTGQSCNNGTKCEDSVFLKLSIANKITDQKSLTIQNYLLTAFLLLYVLFIQYLTYFMRMKERKSDQQIDSPSDYSIMVSELPQGTTERDLLRMVDQERHLLDPSLRKHVDNLSIRDIIMSFEMSQYLEEMKEEEQNYLEAKIDDINCNYYFRKIPKPTKYSSFAIITFNIQDAKDVFQEPQTCLSSIKNFCCNMGLKFGSYKVKEKPVVVKRAPEPDDIRWENADIPRSSVLKRKILTYFCCICILVLGGYIQYLLQVKKLSITDDSLQNIYNIISSASITIFNIIISVFLQVVTEKEGDKTRTRTNSSLLIKASLFQFFNAGIFYTFARILALQVSDFNIQGSQSQELTIFMLFNAIIPNVSNAIMTVLQIPTSLQRWLLTKGCLKYNQKKANQIFECPKIEFPIKYTYIIRTIWLTCFYATFVPIVVPISIFGLLFFYVVQQFLFRNYYKVPIMLSKVIVYTAINLMNYTGLIMLSGGFLVVFYISFQLNTEFTIVQAIPFIIGLGLCLFVILIPSIKINQKIFPLENKKDPEPTYDQACNKFAVTYRSTHPLSSYTEKMKRSEVGVSMLFKMVQMNHLNLFSKMTSASKVERWTDLQRTNNPFNRLLP